MEEKKELSFLCLMSIRFEGKNYVNRSTLKRNYVPSHVHA